MLEFPNRACWLGNAARPFDGIRCAGRSGKGCVGGILDGSLVLQDDTTCVRDADATGGLMRVGLRGGGDDVTKSKLGTVAGMSRAKGLPRSS